MTLPARFSPRQALRVVLLFAALLFAATGAWAAAPLAFDPPPVDLDHESSREAESQGTDVAPDDAGAVAPQAALPAEADAAGDSRGEPAPGGESAGAPRAAASGGAGKVLRLFGMVEFRAPLKNVPKWERVYKLEKTTPTFGDKVRERMPKDVADRWLALRARLDGEPLKEQIQGVNKFFNQWPYKTDMQVWKVEDYWATPAEFLRRSGDCEDYAIVKYYALRDLGVPASQLRIVALRDSIRGIGHAVLAVFMDDDAYILDNLSNLILPHSKLTHYVPVFSVNEEYRWAHVKPLKQK